MRHDFDDDDFDDAHDGGPAWQQGVIDNLLAMDVLTVDQRIVLYRTAAQHGVDIRRRRYNQLLRQCGLFSDDVVELHYLADLFGFEPPETRHYDLGVALDAALDAAGRQSDVQWDGIRGR